VFSLRPSVISRSCSNQIYVTRAYEGVLKSLQGKTLLTLQLLLSPCKIVHLFCHRRNTAETDIQYRFVGRSARHSSYGRYPAKEANIPGHNKKSPRANTGEEGPGSGAYIHFQQPKVDVAAAIL
jgi:hypothetical protein